MTPNQMELERLEFYFDFISPFAYFAWRRVGGFCARYGLALEAHPVVFGKLLDHWGQLGPAEIPPKSQWVLQYCLRYAHVNGFPFVPPKFHPFYPLPALRLSLPDLTGNRQHDAISAIFEAGWSQGEDLGDVDALCGVLERAGIQATDLAARIEQPQIKERLREETKAAIERGVFGVPTFVLGDRLFWGNDQFEHMALRLEGQDPASDEEIASLARPRATDRKAIPGH